MTITSDIAQRRSVARKTDDPDYRVRREELVHAAARVFRRKGFHAAKLQDIAEEFGKDRASLYYYTSGKDELFHDVVAEAVLSNIEMVDKLYSDAVPSVDKLQCLIVQLMKSYEAHYPYLFVYIQEPMAYLDDSTEWSRTMLALQKRFDDGVRGIIRQGMEDGSLAVSTPEIPMIANAIIGMVGWSHRWFLPNKAMSGESIGKLFANSILHGIVVRPADAG